LKYALPVIALIAFILVSVAASTLTSQAGDSEGGQAPLLADSTGICEIQAYDASGFSMLIGRPVRITGVVTAPPGIFVPSNVSMFVRGLGEDICGVNVFKFGQLPQSVLLGDTLTVEGTVDEYILYGEGSQTQVAFEAEDIISIKKSDTLYVEPEILATGEITAYGEEHEGKLVRVTGRVVGKDGARTFTVNDGTGPVVVYDRGPNFSTDPQWQRLIPGDEVMVTGIVAQADPTSPYLSDYRIWPRLPDPPYQDVMTHQCIPDTVTSRAVLEITDGDGKKVNIFCPECPEPNTVTIRYNGPHTGRTRLRIYDGYGRCVATLEDHVTLCGETVFEWDGRNELMERLPMGLYQVVVTASDPRTGTETQEMVPIVIGRRLK
jgi:hypothetical protein